MASENDERWRGWVSSPLSRGTIDIVWQCLSTVVLCNYVMLHLNVPAPSDRYWTRFWRKMRWAIVGFLAPEIPMLFACGQWASAKRSRDAMRALGHENWSIEHGFYADSGGFVLQLLDFDPIPVSAKQLEYLVRQKIVPVPGITKNEIIDKSKADEISRIITCFQAGWLVLQLLGRAGQGLSITPIELTTISIVGCSFTTLWFWRKKPLDVCEPTRLKADFTIAQVQATAGIMRDFVGASFRDTPLDFIEPEPYMSRKWNRMILRWIEQCGLQTTPIQRIPNDRDPQPSNGKQHMALAVSTAVFASVHLIAWNADFPTSWEVVFWRANCLLMWVLLAVYGTIEVVVICWKEKCTNLGLDTLGGYKRRWPACLWFIVPATLYGLSSIGLIAESIWSLRALPEDAFKTVQWTDYFPHLS
jgi:hypothetical protein